MTGPHGSGNVSQPAGPEALFRALDLGRQGRLPQALHTLKQASALAPERADILTELGNLYQQLNDQHTALACYRQAVQAQPDFVPATEPGVPAVQSRRARTGQRTLRTCARQQPSPINRLLAATVLPVIYDSVEDVDRWRKRLSEGVRQLADDGVTIETANTLVPTSFFLAYQGENDVEIARDYGRIYRGVMCGGLPASNATSAEGLPPIRQGAVSAAQPAGLRAKAGGGRLAPSGGGRIRVGFLSAYFRDHTIGARTLAVWNIFRETISKSSSFRSANTATKWPRGSERRPTGTWSSRAT